MRRTEHEPWCWMNPTNKYYGEGVNECDCDDPSLVDVINEMRELKAVLQEISAKLG